MKKLLMVAVALGMAVTPAMAADLETPSAFDWTGFYIGGYLGYADFETEILGVDNSFDGLTGGGIAGYNFQVDSLVFGLEGDIGFTDTDGNFAAPVVHSQEVDMTYAVRARLGFAMDNTLLFLMGGVAFADFQAEDAAGASLADETLTGFQIGGGIEHAFTENITGRLDALYSDYGGTGGAFDFDVEGFAVRAGVNVLF